MLKGELDHVLWAVPDLDKGMAEIERLTGVAPKIGGRHPGVGTYNALLAIGEKTFLEIIAPDPSQDRFSSFGNLVKGVTQPHLVTWVARTSDARRLSDQVQKGGLLPGVILALSRRRPDGTSVSWRTITIGGHNHGPIVPYFIEWRSEEHPADLSPRGCHLQRFEIESPDPRGVLAVLDKVGLHVPVVEGPKARLKLTLETPKGRVTLT